MNKALWFAGILIGLMLAWYGYGLYLTQYQITPVKSSSDLVWYQVPEIGIEFQISQVLADKLIYTYQSHEGMSFGIAFFSSQELSLVYGCRQGGLMEIRRYVGTPNDYGFTNNSLNIKQFQGSFVVFDGPSLACKDDKRFQTYWNNLARSNQTSETWISLITGSAREVPVREPVLSLADSVDNKDLVWYQVPELGIEFQITNQVADELIYAVSESSSNGLSGGVAFSSKELTKIPGCEASFGPLGTLTKLKGIPDDYKENEYLMARNPKQFDGFFVVWSGPQAVCATEEYLDEFDSYFQNNRIFDRWSDIVFDTIRNIR